MGSIAGRGTKPSDANYCEERSCNRSLGSFWARFKYGRFRGATLSLMRPSPQPERAAIPPSHHVRSPLAARSASLSARSTAWAKSRFLPQRLTPSLAVRLRSWFPEVATVVGMGIVGPFRQCPRRGLKWLPERVNMLGNARFERVRETSISGASHYAEVVFVKKHHRIGNLKCKRNYRAGNLLRHSWVSSMFYQNGRFCP